MVANQVLFRRTDHGRSTETIPETPIPSSPPGPRTRVFDQWSGFCAFYEGPPRPKFVKKRSIFTKARGKMNHFLAFQRCLT